jgi:hypothetical protein
MDIDRIGISFDHDGDYVYWLWPWNREGNGKYYSTSFVAQYKTLADLDREWEGFEKAYDGGGYDGHRP